MGSMCGSRAVAGKFQTPCGQVRAGRWCGLTLVLLLLADLFIYYPGDSIHNDCNEEGDCGVKNTIWDSVGIFVFVLPACILCALPCCGNELRERPKPLGCIRTNICGIQPAVWFLTLALGTFFLGNALLHLMDFVWLSSGDKQNSSSDLDGSHPKPTGRKVCDAIGTFLLIA